MIFWFYSARLAFFWPQFSFLFKTKWITSFAHEGKVKRWSRFLPRQSGVRLRLRGGGVGGETGARHARPIRFQTGKVGVLGNPGLSHSINLLLLHRFWLIRSLTSSINPTGGSRRRRQRRSFTSGWWPCSRTLRSSSRCLSQRSTPSHLRPARGAWRREAEPWRGPSCRPLSPRWSDGRRQNLKIKHFSACFCAESLHQWFVL